MSAKDTVERAFSGWMDNTGLEGDIVISSRIRLARNIAHMKFPYLLDEKNSDKIVQNVKDTLDKEKVKKELGKIELTLLKELNPNEQQILVEKHLISPALLEKVKGRAVGLSEDDRISVMVNEEDHLRIQCLFPGLQLEEAWQLASKIDDLLEENLEIVFCEERGYLTACPTNVGTGLRASVMMHLPALVMTNQINRVITVVTQVGLTVRGLYGEGTEATGNLFQISNQITLGQTEEEIISKLKAVTMQIINQERASREALCQGSWAGINDRVWRAFGILSYAKSLSSYEAMSLLSDLRLGIDLKILPQIEPRLLNELLVLIGPAYLQKFAGKELSPGERDIYRAKFLNDKLKAFEK
ncbi:MAG: protein arginine kinase [Clostridia bacterium]|nr:protein arginine kinase [Clostridia bacterium]